MANRTAIAAKAAGIATVAASGNRDPVETKLIESLAHKAARSPAFRSRSDTQAPSGCRCQGDVAEN